MPSAQRKAQPQPLHILLVDGEPGNVTSITQALLLYKEQIQVRVAASSEEALHILCGTGGYRQLSRPYVILLELSLPGESGLTLLRRLRQDEELKRSVVFVLTDSAAEADKRAAYAYLVAGYIVKSKLGNYAHLVNLLLHYQQVVSLCWVTAKNKYAQTSAKLLPSAVYFLKAAATPASATAMFESLIHLHTCGYPIYIDRRWNGTTWEPIFVDALQDSPTEGEAVKACPGCQLALRLADVQRPAFQ